LPDINKNIKIKFDVTGVMLDKNHPTGRLDEVSIDPIEFERLRREERKMGAIKGRKVKRNDFGDPAVEGYKGPWAGWDDDDPNRGIPSGPTDYQIMEHYEQKLSQRPDFQRGELSPGQERSVLHCRHERDPETGRSYLQIPLDVDELLDYNLKLRTISHAPKKCTFTWAGHTKGLASIKIVPGSGHLMLTASHDQNVKLWSIYGERKCLRTYIGHDKPLRDVSFWGNDPNKFMSLSFDGWIKVWDLESGKCLSKLQQGLVIPHTASTNPTDPNIIISGGPKGKIVQWDLRQDKITMDYLAKCASSHGRNTIHTLTFLQHKPEWFVSTSEDSVIRVWQSGISFPVRCVSQENSDPFEMPRSIHHPLEPIIAFQSLANQVTLFNYKTDVQLDADPLQSTELLSPLKRKLYGHEIGGYPCGISFNGSDGRYLASGEKNGISIWEWKTGQMVKRIENAHQNKVCIDVAWLPRERSKLLSVGWDGTIKLWE